MAHNSRKEFCQLTLLIVDFLSGKVTSELRIPLNHTFTLEYMVHMPVPEWGRGKHIYLPFHDSGVVTERGVEFPYPPIDGIYLVH